LGVFRITMKNKTKVKFHCPIQQYGFAEFEGDNLEELTKLYNQLAETKLNFFKGKFVEVKTFTNEVVRYNDLTHTYTDLEGNVLLSGSQFSKSIKPSFDKAKLLPMVAKKYKVSEAHIDAMWTANSKISLTFGNAIHYAMEQWFKHKDHSTEKDYHLPKHPFLKEVVTSFPDKDKLILPEVVVSDIKNKMVGRVDGLMKDLTPIDYKSDADIKKNLKYHFMQLSFYATILINHGHKVDKVIVWNYTDKWTKYESEVLKINLNI